MLRILKEECTACGYCAKIKSDFFSLDEHGFAFVKNSPKSLDKNLSEVIKKCPANCIIWETL